MKRLKKIGTAKWFITRKFRKGLKLNLRPYVVRNLPNETFAQIYLMPTVKFKAKEKFDFTVLASVPKNEN